MYFVPWPIVCAWIKPLPGSVQEQVDTAPEMGFDGIIVYVDEGGKEPAFYAAGYKNRANKLPADPHSLFKIASVSKLYVALALAKMERSGRISLDKSLANYLPELKGRIEHATDISLRMMARHRSGIPNFTDTPNFWVNPPNSAQEALERVFDLPANFEPDQDYEYCNTNYLLLAMVLDKVLGHGHLQFIQEEILTPLNLRRTYGSIHEVNMDEVMSGYYVGYEADLKSEDTGSMLATAEDVGRFIRALNDGAAFTDPQEQAIYTSLYEFGHTGLIPGYQTIAKYHHDIDAVVIQFTNTVDFEGYTWSLSEIMYHRIVTIIRNQP